MTVIDADGHVTESAEQVVKYMDAPFRHRQLVFPIVPADGWDRRLITKFHDTAATADAWLRALDKGGMEQAVLFPTLGLFMSFIKDRTWAVQFCRAYNTLMHEEFITASPRLRAVALLPIQDPEAAAEELGRAVRELGHVGAMLAADGSHVLGDECFTPIVFEGILERFPDLRLAFLEAGAGWAPYWMERMDDEYDKRGEVEAPALRKKPSDYVRSGKIYFSCEADEWLLPQALKLVGENQIVYASDFPHWDHSFPGSIDEIRNRGDLTDAQKRKVLADNCRRLYKL